MRFVRFRDKQQVRCGYLQGGQVVDLENALEHFSSDGALIERILTSPLEKLAQDPEMFSQLRRLAEKTREALPGADYARPAEEITFLPPVSVPGKVLCVGLNYPSPGDADDHAAPEYPVLFHKAASALTGHRQPILLPRISQQVEYEGELAVVIGKEARQLSGADVEEHLAGYTIANDIGARDVQARSSQWTSGKMFDTFCPLGPALVTVDEVPRPNKLRIQTRLNGETVQDSSTDQMIFPVEDLVSYISALTTLLPGDLILTGSPKNRGDQADPRKLLRPADCIQVEIESIGVLTNPVAAEE